MFDKLKEKFIERFSPMCDYCKEVPAVIRLWSEPDKYFCKKCAYIVAKEIISTVENEIKELGLDGEEQNDNE